MTRTCSHPASRIADDRAGPVGGRVADAGEQAVLDEQARRAGPRGVPRRAPRTAARRAGARRAPACASPGTARTSRRRPRSSSRSAGSGSTPGETMTGSPSPSATAATSSTSAAWPGSSWMHGVLAHGEVEQDDAGLGEVAADRDHLVRGLAVARALVVVRAVEAERARVAAVGGEVHEAVQEHRVARVPRAHLAGGREHQRRLFAGAQQRLEVALVRGGALEDVRADARDGPAGAHAVSGTRGRRRAGRRLVGRGGVSGRPMGTTATRRAGVSTPSNASIAGAASTGAVIQHEP